MRSPAPTPLGNVTNFPRRSPRTQKTISHVATSQSPRARNVASVNLFNSPESAGSHEKATDVPSRTVPSVGDGQQLQQTTADQTDESPADQACQNITEPEGGAELIEEPRNASYMDKAYTFLSKQNKNTLRKLCKELSCRTSGNKTELLYRAIRHLRKSHKKKFDFKPIIDSIVQENRFTKFLESSQVCLVEWKNMPEDGVIVQHLRNVGDRISEEDDCEEGERDPTFTHSEFARMLLIMRDDEQAKAAMFSLPQPLNRGALDSGMSKDSFWNIIAARFNNRNVPVRFEFSGTIDDIDPSKPPLCQRSGTVLKDQFQKLRPEFTKCYDNWCRSGQNDPDRFVRFLAFNNDGSMSAQSKRALIMFKVCRLGTANEHELLVKTGSKLMVDGGCEGGIVRTNDMVDNATVEPEATRVQKRRKKGSEAFQDKVHDIGSNIDKVHSILTECIQAQTSSGKAREPDVDLWDNEEDSFNLVEKSYEALQRLRKDCANNHSNDTIQILRIAESRYQKALAKYNRKESMADAETDRD